MTVETKEETRQASIDFKLDRSNLYLEETFTDLTGTVKRFTPVKPDGTPDRDRKTLYLGQANVYTSHGPVPIQNTIPAKELSQAFKRYPEAMEQALQHLLEEAKKLGEQKTSSIIQASESRIIVP
jgi:hypothetical protein